jgi:hypothetical protein
MVAKKVLKEVVIESDINVYDGGILTQLLCFWTLSVAPFSFKTQHFGD